MLRRALIRVVRRARAALAWARGEPPPRRELGSFAEVALAGTRARDLEARFSVAAHAAARSPDHLATLFLLDLFDRLRSQRGEYFADIPPSPEILDVGAKDFESALALVLFFGGERLTGIELEPERRGADGGTARARAAARLRRLPGGARARYLGGDVRLHEETYDVVTWLHPFVDARRLQEWGLAPEHLRPRELLAHVFARVRPGGLLVVVNQDEDEDVLQRALFDGLRIARDSLEVELSFRARDVPAYVHLARRPRATTDGP